MSEEILMMSERAADDHPSVPPLGVGFFVRPREDKKRAKAAGHPVFYDDEWVKIVVPGDKNSTIERPASEKDKKRFPQAYAAFKQREQKATVVGMPIEEWPQVTRAMAMTLKCANVFTVEALAGISDGHIDKIGFTGRELRAKAQAFLAVSKDSAAAQQFKADSERKDLQIAELQRQINDLASRLQGPEGTSVTMGQGGGAGSAIYSKNEPHGSGGTSSQSEKRGPGRPRKVETEAA